MEEKKFVALKKDELNIKEFIKENLGKGKIAEVSIEYTPVGEKIIISTNKPGFVIGRKGEKIIEITKFLKKRFKLENPNIEIKEITQPEFDAQTVADDIALTLEKLGSLKFKIVAYKMMERIMRAGAMGVEIRLGGKLPSERAKSWRFASGYLKKTGETAKIVSKAEAIAKTMMGVIGVKVSILSPDKKIHDQIIINEDLKRQIRTPIIQEVKEEKKKKPRKEKENAQI